MGKVTYAPGIQYVQGAMAKPSKKDGHNHGDYLIGKHRTAPTSNPNCTTLFVMKEDTFKRDTFSALEREKQTMFATAARAAQARMKNISTIAEDKAAFAAQTAYKTLYQFIFNAEYDKLRG